MKRFSIPLTLALLVMIVGIAVATAWLYPGPMASPPAVTERTTDMEAKGSTPAESTTATVREVDMEAKGSTPAPAEIMTATARATDTEAGASTPAPAERTPAAGAAEDCSLTPSEHKINALEAIRRAECFVIANGYTDLPPLEDESQLTSESLEFGSSVEEILQFRHDTLERKAFGIRPGSRTDDGWSVVFLYNLDHPRHNDDTPAYREHLKTVGRVVMMDAYGGNIQIQHQDTSLKAFQPVEEVSR
jgi:hypothetical protein